MRCIHIEHSEDCREFYAPLRSSYTGSYKKETHINTMLAYCSGGAFGVWGLKDQTRATQKQPEPLRMAQEPRRFSSNKCRFSEVSKSAQKPREGQEPPRAAQGAPSMRLGAQERPQEPPGGPSMAFGGPQAHHPPGPPKSARSHLGRPKSQPRATQDHLGRPKSHPRAPRRVPGALHSPFVRYRTCV